MFAFVVFDSVFSNVYYMLSLVCLSVCVVERCIVQFRQPCDCVSCLSSESSCGWSDECCVRCRRLWFCVSDVWRQRWVSWLTAAVLRLTLLLLLWTSAQLSVCPHVKSLKIQPFCVTDTFNTWPFKTKWNVFLANLWNMRESVTWHQLNCT